MNESLTIKSISLKNRVLVASGTFGYGDEVPALVNVNDLGGIITKSLSLKPRDGNPPPRIAETASGMLNSIGLANIGVHRFIEEKIPFLRKLQTAIIANVAASSVDEYCTVVELLDVHHEISGYEINVSCPNVKEGGLAFGTDISKVALITREVRKRTARALIIKLTPNVTSISEFAKASENEGADAVSVINTLVGMAVDIKTRRPKLSTITGGLSGPAIKPIALAKVFEAAKAVKIPVIGIGGIATWEDAVEFLLVGASAVQVGTASFINPNSSVAVAKGMREFCIQQNLTDVGELVGRIDTTAKHSSIQSWL